MRPTPKLQMVIVGQWTGKEAKALRTAMRLSIRAFADHLGVGVRTVASWEAGGEAVCPYSEMQQILDATLSRLADDAKARFTYQLFADPPLVVARVTGKDQWTDDPLSALSVRPRSTSQRQQDKPSI